MNYLVHINPAHNKEQEISSLAQIRLHFILPILYKYMDTADSS